MTTEAKEILCSENPSGNRLMTMLCRYPQFIHNEHLRHRSFSFSVSSNRAIPLSKALEEVRDDNLRAAPVWWGKEQKGMSAGEELPNTILAPNPLVGRRGELLTDHDVAKDMWARAAIYAADSAEKMGEFGLHKSIASRLLQPFLHHNVLVTGTTSGWMNFFGLRLDKAAQAEIRVLAEKMWIVWNESKPQKLNPGQWHLPFTQGEDFDDTINGVFKWSENETDKLTPIKISVARCARLSYFSFETNKRSTIEEDLALYNRLVGSIPIHASPAEHQATPDFKICPCSPDPIEKPCIDDSECPIHWANPHQSGNLGPGWIQYRKTLPNESIAPLPKEYQK